MPLTNFILNIVGLLLWVNWLSLHFDPLAKTSATSLVGTLRKADPTGPRRWQSLAGVISLVIIRAVIYWQIGPALNWTPRLALGPIGISFRSDFFARVLLFSTLSFICALAAFYFSLLLLSVVNRNAPETDSLQKLVRLYFKWLEPLPVPVKLFLPLIAGALFWLALHPLLTRLGIIPGAKSTAQLLAQAAIIGAGGYLSWKYLVLGILILHLLNSYVYLGSHPVWDFVNATARNLLHPLRGLGLRIGRIDLLPVVAIALVLLIVNFCPIADFFSRPRGTFRPWLYGHLPF